MNGEAIQVPEDVLTLLHLMDYLGLASHGRIIEMNGVIFSQSDWSTALLSSDAHIEIIQFMGGGACHTLSSLHLPMSRALPRIFPF